MASTKRIVIEGEAVSAIEEIVHRRTTLPEWLAAMNRLTPAALTTPILPNGAVLYAQKGDQQLVAINQPAAVKKVIWRGEAYRDRGTRKTRWGLAVPNHLFLLLFAKEAIYSSHLYFVPKPVADEKDMLYYTNLANIYFQPQNIPTPICSGSIRLDVKASFASRCQAFIDAFWTTEFNDDIFPQIREGGSIFSGRKDSWPKELLSLNAWEEATAKTPSFLADMTWPFAPLCSLSEIVNDRWQVNQ